MSEKEQLKEQIIKAYNFRHATKQFDPNTESMNQAQKHADRLMM